MDLAEITLIEFEKFYRAVKAFFGDEPVYFDGRSFETEVDEYLDWTFCLVNRDRAKYMFVPKHIAFFFINLALNNVSPLPNTLTTFDVTCERLHYLYHRYALQ